MHMIFLQIIFYREEFIFLVYAVISLFALRWLFAFAHRPSSSVIATTEWCIVF